MVGVGSDPVGVVVVVEELDDPGAVADSDAANVAVAVPVAVGVGDGGEVREDHEPLCVAHAIYCIRSSDIRKSS